MTYVIRIRRQKSSDAAPFWQEFDYDGDENDTVSSVLLKLNEKSPLTDRTGKAAVPVAWEHSCMVRKCGACAMRINGRPRLACSCFLKDLKSSRITLEPLGKFPVVRDLIVDRSAIFESMKRLQVWLGGDAYMSDITHELRYQSARCLMCGLCMEICPNFSCAGDFAGAIAPVNAYRILNEEQEGEQRRKLSSAYRKRYFDGCGQSLSCHDICPAGIPVEELAVRSNAAAVWNKFGV